MPENIFKNNSNEVVEREIAELSALIAQKRSQLETTHNIVSDQELIKETLAQNFSHEGSGEGGGSEGLKVVPVTKTASTSYLNDLDDESVATVNSFVNTVPKQGLKATLKNLATHPPFIIDAVHDILVDSLYNEMKEKGWFK